MRPRPLLPAHGPLFVVVVSIFCLVASCCGSVWAASSTVPKRKEEDNYKNRHRIFPAASIELYTSDSPVLGVVASNVTVSITVSSTHGVSSVQEFLQPAVERFQNGLTKFFPDFYNDNEENPLDLPLHHLDRIEVVVQSDKLDLYHGVPEDYEISILDGNDDSSSVVTLKASTVFGALHSLESLGQLMKFGWMSHDDKTSTINAVYCISDIPLFVSDSPAFRFRGLMIDTSRHYLPLDLILHNLDAMSMNKMNVLHWHLTDSESFPFKTPSYPELAVKGAYHPKRIYTPNDIRLVVEQARLRGIRVIPEIDMPGHTASIAKSHAEVMSHCPNPQEPMNPTVPETYKFVETIYQDLNDLFPDAYVHVGGDEVWMDCWIHSPSIAQWMKDHGMKNDTRLLYEYFETRLLKIVGETIGKTPMVWQEVFNLNLTVPDNTIVDVWKGFDQGTLEKATKAGYSVVLSGCWYLDHLAQTWESFYTCDPLNFTGPHDLMIGGHASMWGEHVDASNFVSRVWPRASAVAERLWTGNVTGNPAATIAERIHNFRCRMVQHGFSAGPTRPGSCPTEVSYQPLRQRDDVTAMPDLNRPPDGKTYR